MLNMLKRNNKVYADFHGIKIELTGNTHAVRMRQSIEVELAMTLVNDILAAGYYINIDNGGESNEFKNPTNNGVKIAKAMFATDEEQIGVYEKPSGAAMPACIGWVRLVYGNDGWDVINDYHTSLERFMTNVNALIDIYSN